MTPRVRALSEFDDPVDATAEYRRVDAAAFGQRPDAAQRDSKQPLVHEDRLYLATVNGATCGAAGSFPMELTLPGGATPAVAGVSDVGVLATHRRRGVLSALIRRLLEDCAERAEPMAVLHASEGGIYRRFGFGPSISARHVSVDVHRAEFRADTPRAAGHNELRQPAEVLSECRAVHDEVRRSCVGGLSRSEAWWRIVLGDVESYIGGSPRQLVMLHRGPDGAADGYALYEVSEDWSSGQPRHSLRVRELVGRSDAVELELWRAMFEHDLVERVSGPIAVDDVLFDVLVDPRQVSLDREQDLLWARVLDVEEVFSQRSYRGSGSLVVQVDDPWLDLVGGCYRIDVDDGVGGCVRTDETPEVRIDVADLGACSLGGGSVRRLVRAGRVDELATGAAATADRLLQIDPLPWCWVRF